MDCIKRNIALSISKTFIEAVRDEYKDGNLYDS